MIYGGLGDKMKVLKVLYIIYIVLWAFNISSCWTQSR